MAAYRSGELIEDRRTGQTFDYSRKQGVLYSEVIAPENAPNWARNRIELWNRSEAAERRGDAHVAREIQISLPHELSNFERREVTTAFARHLSDRYGVAVDTCIHAPHKDGDERNHHAHLMICARPFDETKEHGLGNKIRAFDAVSCQRAGAENHVELWRKEWQRLLNQSLERAEVKTEEGALVQLDHRSYQRQGSDLEPQLKEGPAATAKKRRGEATDRAAINEAVKERNEERQRMAQEVDAPELTRRRAEQMNAEQWRDRLPTSSTAEPRLRRAASLTTGELQNLLSVEKPEITPTPRRAETLTAPQARELIPANDNQPVSAVVANDNQPIAANDNQPGMKRFSWENEAQFQQRIQAASEYTKPRPPDEKTPPHGPDYKR